MRKKWNLHQNWYFTREDIVENYQEYVPEKRPDIWEKVSVPHTFRLEPYAHKGVRTAQGVGSYCKCFSLEAGQKSKRLFITFEAVMGVTEVWLNGILLHTNYGGYLPFVVCLNDAAYFDGRNNLLIVRTDNRDNGQVPPGKPQELLDFTYFGGIYRNVWLEETEEIYITDPLFENAENSGGLLIEYPLVSAKKALIEVKTQLRSLKTEAKSVTLIQEVVTMNGESVIRSQKEVLMKPDSAEEILMELEIQNPSLWSLKSPTLYEMVTSVLADNILFDVKRTKFGIRQIEVDRTKGVLINGEVQPLLSGINRHQDYLVIGSAAPSSMQRRDAILFKKAGFQVVRAAHYPMAEDFLNACDELGILVFEATPGWQWFPVDQPEPFSSRVRQNIRQMVRRDRNHPCILAYEVVLNETYHVPYGFTRKSALTALAEQKSAKIAAESYGYDARPEANGIDRESDFIYGFQQPLEKTEKAVMFLREYTDCWIEAYGEFASRRVTRGRTDGFYPSGEARNLKKANQMLWQHLEGEYSLARCYALRNENPAFTGCAIWTGIDSRGAQSEIGPCGIWNAYRLPKTSYWAFASQQDSNPILYLATEWTRKAPVLDKSEEENIFGTDTAREIYVYSNAAEVELTVEMENTHTIIWKKRATPYLEEGAAFLPHPPFYFAGVPYKDGTILHACGYDKEGRIIAEDSRRTAGKPYRIQLKTETLGIPLQADDNDIVLLHAEILDKNGVLCTDAEHRIYFETEGDIKIVGDNHLLADTNPARAEAGIASVYLQAGKTAGRVSVAASAEGLCEDKIEISLVSPENPDLPGIAYETIHEKRFGEENLSVHDMAGDAKRIQLAEVDGSLYPDSICLYGTANWKLRDETYLEMACSIVSGDRNAELLIYLDDILRWKGKPDLVDKITVIVDNASEMRMEVRAAEFTEIMLCSPYLWKGRVEENETELQGNIAFGKPASATVNTENAEDVWGKGGWLGGRPADGAQEWQVDLGELMCVRNARVYVGGQMGSDCTTFQYEIHTSADGISWEKKIGSNRTGWSNGVLDHFSAQNVRYIKVVFIKVDGTLSAGIQNFEAYRDYGVDSVKEYALSGINVKEADLVFSPECTEYTLPAQKKITVQAIAYDPNAKVTICGEQTEYPLDGRIVSMKPVIVSKEECGGKAVIEVSAASGKASRKYFLHF
ncbi:MAG: glycoside hydrolase family 2 TIM barrel-domain containing protein [Oliverpabstia sp.]